MANPAPKTNDQLAKTHLVLITAVLALVGFVLEIGPVAGAVFPTIAIALALELSTLGFLPYLALAASAAVGLHLTEEEPTPKEKKSEVPEAPQPTPEGEMVGQRVRVRPDLHQMRMIFTALGGYAVLKGLTLALMWPQATVHYGILPEQLLYLFQFGFVYVALGWLVMWQFLRWYAQRRKWVRLQEELVGGNVTQVVALFVLIKPVINIGNIVVRFSPTPSLVIAILLNLAVIAAAWLLWAARPVTLRRTVVGLLTVGGVIILLTVIYAILKP